LCCALSCHFDIAIQSNVYFLLGELCRHTTTHISISLLVLGINSALRFLYALIRLISRHPSMCSTPHIAQDPCASKSARNRNMCHHLAESETISIS